MARQIIVDIIGDSTKFSKGIDAAITKSGQFKNILEGIGQGVGQAGFGLLEDAISKITTILPELIGKGLGWAETVEKIQVATGTSAEGASHFAGELEYLGISSEAAGEKLGLLTKGIKTHETALKDIGVSIRDENGDYLDQIAIVNAARSAVNAMTAGINKTTLATQLFGRSGAGMLEWLHLTDRQVEILDGKLDALGVTMSQTMVDDAKNARREGNLLELAMQGLANTITADVAPAITVAVDSVVAFFATNSKAIAGFASDILGFIMGIVSAITGMSLTAQTFTGEMNAAAGGVDKTAAAVVSAQDALDAYDGSTKKATGSTKANTTALDLAIKMLDNETAAIDRLDAAQDRTFNKAMAHINAQLGAELSAMDAAEKADRIHEQRASLDKQMAEAKAALSAAQAGTADESGQMVVDPKAVQAAQDQITQINRASIEFNASLANDARREEIAAVQDYLAGIEKAETDWTSKKGLLGQLQKDEAILNSQIATAQQKGDLQGVADLTLELQGVKAAEIRATQGVENETAKTAAAARKTDIEKQKADIKSVGGVQADTTRQGLVDTLDAAKKAQAAREAAAKYIDERFPTDHKLNMAIYGDIAGPKNSITSAMEDARLAGVQFGKDVKAAIDSVTGAAKGLFGWLGDVKTGLDGIAKDPVFKFLTGETGPKASLSDLPNFLNPQPPGNGVQPGLTDIIGHLLGFSQGGTVPGRSGEPRVIVAHGGETVTPVGAVATSTFTMTGDIIIQAPNFPGSESDKRALARSLFDSLNDEARRRGLTLAGAR